eukprot:gnl/TRDRNA2_/TRDRNA2_94596_c0_seq1.p1 gnl/TRDRNA2_/TRDRNA2_94596_c0~~gnl/TRDRNA2_/TRDRNA2_94596_c0_seq1.p1  ORF type:complete len:576 (+),score=57.92 gnl/TRDRNA2_/TRDRNA2_94596_c0_seq1:156-1883(+)
MVGETRGCFENLANEREDCFSMSTWSDEATSESEVGPDGNGHGLNSIDAEISNLLQSHNLSSFAKAIHVGLGVTCISDFAYIDSSDLTMPSVGMTKVQAAKLLHAAAQHNKRTRQHSQWTAAASESAYEIGLKVNLWSLVDINDDTEVFKLMFDLVLEWEDPSLRNVESRVFFTNGQEMCGIVRPDGQNWIIAPVHGSEYECKCPKERVHRIETPRLTELTWSPLGKFTMTNSVSPPQILLESPPELVDGTIGKLRVFVKQIGEFKDRYDLQTFPFDQHHLRVFIMGTVPNHQLQFRDLQQSSFRIYDSKGCAWKVEKPQDGTAFFSVKVEDQVGKWRNHAYAKAEIKLFVERRVGFYMWNYIFFIFALTLISFSNFAIPLSDVVSRSSITVTLLLAAVSFKQLMSSRLPVKPYRTDMENYVLHSFVLLCAPTFEQIVFLWSVCAGEDRSKVLSLVEGGYKESGAILADGYDCDDGPKQADRQFGFILAAMWIANTVRFLLLGLRRVNRCPRCRCLIDWSLILMLMSIAMCWLVVATMSWYPRPLHMYWAALPLAIAGLSALLKCCQHFNVARRK